MRISTKPSLFNHRRPGLTILPVMATLVMLSVFLGMLAKRQAARELSWRLAVRQAQARQIALSQMSLLQSSPTNLEKLVATPQVFPPGAWPGLNDSVEVSIATDPTHDKGFTISVKIPANAESRFVREQIRFH